MRRAIPLEEECVYGRAFSRRFASRFIGSVSIVSIVSIVGLIGSG